MMERMNERQKDSMNLPFHIINKLLEKGIPEANIRLFCKSDMGIEMEFCDCFAVLTDTELVVLETLGGIFPRKTHNVFDMKKTKTDIVERSFRTYSLEDYENFHLEEFLSGGRVVARDKNSGLDTLVLYFSNTVKDGIYTLCHGITDDTVTQEEIIFGKREIEGGPDMRKGDGISGTPSPRPPHGDGKNSFLKGIKSGETKRLISKLLPFFLKYKWYTVIVLIMVVLSSLLGLLSPYVSGAFFIDEVLNLKGSFYGQIAKAIIIIAGTKLLSTVFMMVHSIVTAKISARVVYDLKKTIFESIQRLSLSFFSSRQTGGLMTQINQDSRSLYWFFVDGLPYFVTNIVQFVAIVILLFVMNWQVSLIVMLPIPIYVAVRRSLYRFARKIHARNYSRSRIFNSFVADVLTGNRVVKAFSHEDLEQKKFDKRSYAYADSVYDGTVKTNWFIYPVTLILEVGTYSAWAFGGYMVAKGAISGNEIFTYGTLVTYISMLAMAYAPLDFFNRFGQQLSECMNAAHRLFEIMDTVPDVMDRPDPIIPEKLDGTVEFKDVSFEYVKNRRVIEKVSFKVEAGETIGIVGHTGAGKSTIVNLIMRLYDVTEGAVLVDGNNVKDLPMSFIRDNIAIVSQETYLFRGSIADNIRYAAPDATDEEVVEAAKAAGAHDFIVKYPDGYNTQIGFGNKGLSGGECQRISIARAILKNPKILILDEATAAMDTATELKIQKAITDITRGKTTIIIAHRLSTLKDANRLIVIEDGRMTETGTHRELIEKKGDYYTLYKMQLDALKLIGVEE